MAWWDGRLIIANREPAALHAFTPPDRFEIFKEQGLTNPFGVAVDPQGRLLVTENKDEVLHSSGSGIAVFTPDGTTLAAMIVGETGPNGEPGLPTNVYGLAFGGADGRTLFISGKGKYRLSQVRLPVAGEVVSRATRRRP